MPLSRQASGGRNIQSQQQQNVGSSAVTDKTSGVDVGVGSPIR